jgi:Fe2+ transport system protein FeoA
MILRLDLSLHMLRTSDIRPGDSARLLQVGGERSFRRRLMELGFLPGTNVRLVRRVTVGDLVEFEVRGGHISLRASEAVALVFESSR